MAHIHILKGLQQHSEIPEVGWGSVCIDWIMNQPSGSRELLMEELGFEREAAEFTCKVGGLGLERATSQEQETAGWAWTDNQMRGYPDD